MFPIHKEVKGITHPQIASLYLKHDFAKDGSEEDVLVIETIKYDDDLDQEINGRDEYIMDLLLDLQGLKQQVERQGGYFSRVDIRCH